MNDPSCFEAISSTCTKLSASVNAYSLVFVIRDSRPGGGAEKQSLIFAEGLSERGFNVYLYTEQYDDEHLKNYAPFVRKLTSIVELLKIKKPCILISFLKSDHIFSAKLVIKGFRWVPFERTHPIYYQRFGASNQFVRTLKLQALASLYKLLSQAMLVQTSGASRAWSQTLRFRRPIFVVANSFELKDISQVIKVSSVLQIAFVGRLLPIKDPFLALTTVKYLIDKLKVKCELQVYGRGPLEDDLKKRVEEMGLQDAVTFHGFQKNVLQAIAKCDIFFMTSHIEGMPNALGEAMALGLPCVVTDFPGGARELLGDSVFEHSGQLVSSREPEALARQLAAFANNREKARQIGQKNRKVIETRFTPPLILADLEKALNQIILLL